MATYCTAADVVNYAPEFEGVPLPLIDKFIALAAGQMNATAWGSRAMHACILLTAHMLTVHKVKDGSGAGGAGVGSVSSVSVGQVSVTYAGAAGNISNGADAGLASSVYGLEFARLVTLAAQGIAVV